MLGGEEAGGFGFEVEDADDFIFDDQRDGQLGADVGVGGDVVLVFRDVFDEEGSALEGGLADDAPADLEADALDLWGMADLEAHPEFLGAVVDQQNREDAVVDDGADEVGHPVHQGVEVEGGVEGVGEGVEKVYLERLDADVSWLRGLRCARTVVSLEVVFGRYFRRWRGRRFCAAWFVSHGHSKSR